MPKTEVEIQPEYGSCDVRIDEIDWDLGMPRERLINLTVEQREAKPWMSRVGQDAWLTPDEADEVADALKARAAEVRARGPWS